MKQLERVYGWLLIAPSVLPLVIWGGVVYPYLVPKTLLFYTISLVLAGVTAVLVAYETPFYWKRLARPISWTPAVLLALAYAASAHGIDFYHSFWSIFVRGDGLLMLTCVVADFYFLYIYATREWLTRLFRVVAFTASAVALYGIGEWLVSGGRIGSLLGNAAFFAGYLGIALFVTLLAAREATPVWRNAAYAGVVAQVLAIVLTATRGTILALLVAGAVCLLALSIKGQQKIKTASRFTFVGLVVFAALFFTFRGALSHVPFSPVARLAGISTNDPDVASRLFIWKHMVRQVAAQPLLGIGAEHIDVPFNQFYDPTQIQEEWFDRSHNAFLDYAVQYGVGGLVLYLLLIAGFFAAAWRFAKRGEQYAALLCVLLAVTYVVQNFFVFDTISSWWLFLITLAAVLVMSGEVVARESVALSRSTRPLSWAALGIAVVCIVPVTVRPAMAAYDNAHAYGYQISDPAKSVAYLKSGYALNTYGDLEYGYEVYGMFINTQMQTLSGDSLTSVYTEAESILAANFARFPYDARTAMYLAHVLSLAPKGVVEDKDLLSQALSRVIQESPKRSQAWFILVNLAIGQANEYPVGSVGRTSGYAAAKDLLGKYIELVPTLSEPHFVLAQLDFATGDTESAANEAALGAQYYTSNLETARRAIAYYEGAQNWVEAQTFLTSAVALVPNDYALLYDLAKVTFLTGDRASAAQIFLKVKEADPALAQSDSAFLKAITPYVSGT